MAKLAFSQTHVDLEADRGGTKKAIPDPDLEGRAGRGRVVPLAVMAKQQQEPCWFTGTLPC